MDCSPSQANVGSVGARGHTTGRILRRLETEQKYGTYKPCESKLPPRGACVTLLVLNQSRLHTTGRKNKEVSKKQPNQVLRQRGGEQPLQARRLSTPAYNAGGFRVRFSPTRHSPLHTASLEKFQGCSVEGRAGTKIKNIKQHGHGQQQKQGRQEAGRS